MKTGESKVTETGGRSATNRHIPPKLALAVGMPSSPAPNGWRWSALTDLAKLESGHTPSRNHPEYWGGTIPWIGIRDARAHDGRRIEDTEQNTNELGIKNSSARVLPENTVCLSRTASVGYVVVMGRAMATSQDFVNWICSESLEPNFLKYLFIAEDEGLLRFASGSVHQTIYFPEVKAFHICHPPLAEQQRIVGVLDEAFAGLATAQANAEKNLQNARALFESHLQSVFTHRGKGWVETTLGDLVVKTESADPSRSPNTEFVYVDVSSVSNQTLSIQETQRLAGKDAPSRARRLIRSNDVLFATIRPTLRRIAIVPEELDEQVCSTGYVVLRAKQQVDFRWVFYFLQTERFMDAMAKLQKGASYPAVTDRDVRCQPIPVPSLVEQQHVVDQLDTLAAETQRLTRIYEQKQAALAALKKSLLHGAFTGEM